MFSGVRKPTQTRGDDMTLNTDSIPRSGSNQGSQSCEAVKRSTALLCSSGSTTSRWIPISAHDHFAWNTLQWSKIFYTEIFFCVHLKRILYVTYTNCLKRCDFDILPSIPGRYHSLIHSLSALFKKSDLCHLNVAWFLVADVLVSGCQQLLIFWNCPKQQSLWFTQNGAKTKQKNHSVCGGISRPKQLVDDGDQKRKADRKSTVDWKSLE